MLNVFESTLYHQFNWAGSGLFVKYYKLKIFWKNQCWRQFRVCPVYVVPIWGNHSNNKQSLLYSRCITGLSHTNSVLILQTMLNTIRNKDDILFMPYSFQSKRSRQFSCLKNNCSGRIWCSICTFVNFSFSMSSGSVVEQSNG